jgi:hypothetical protein
MKNEEKLKVVISKNMKRIKEKEKRKEGKKK